MKAAKAPTQERDPAADTLPSALTPPEQTTSELSSSEPTPADPIMIPQRLMKRSMTTRPAPSSAQTLRDCIAHELERAERILLQRLGYTGPPEQLLDFLEARCALARSWH